MADSKYLIIYKVRPIASHIYFQQKSITLDYILMPFLYAQTTYVNAVLSPDYCFIFCDQCLLCIVQHVHLSLVY